MCRYEQQTQPSDRRQLKERVEMLFELNCDAVAVPALILREGLGPLTAVQRQERKLPAFLRQQFAPQLIR